MAGDWIKMRVLLDRDPKTTEMSAELACNNDFCRWLGDPVQRGFDNAWEHVTCDVTRDIVIARLLRVWGAALEVGKRIDDSNDLILGRCSKFAVDQIAGVPSFGDAMEFVGWLIVDEEKNTCTFPNLLENNVPASERDVDRRREQSRESSRRYREKHASPRDQNVTSPNVTRDMIRDHQIREDKRREEKKDPYPPLTPPFEKGGNLEVSSDTQTTKNGRRTRRPPKPTIEDICRAAVAGGSADSSQEPTNDRV